MLAVYGDMLLCRFFISFCLSFISLWFSFNCVAAKTVSHLLSFVLMHMATFFFFFYCHHVHSG